MVVDWHDPRMQLRLIVVLIAETRRTGQKVSDDSEPDYVCLLGLSVLTSSP